MRSTVGEAGWLPPAARSTGAAAVYGPPDVGFPEDGVVAVGKVDAAGWVHAEVAARGGAQGAAPTGTVLTLFDWPRQEAATVETVGLGGGLAAVARPARVREHAEERLPGVGPARVLDLGAAPPAAHGDAAEVAGEHPLAELDGEHQVEEARAVGSTAARCRWSSSSRSNSSGVRTGQPRAAAARGRSSRVSRAKARRTVASKSASLTAHRRPFRTCLAAGS